MARNTLTAGLIAIVALVAGLLTARAFLADSARPPDTRQTTVFPSPRAVPQFGLVSRDGRPLGPHYFEQRWTLVFFGFTSCPDVCPTTLAMLAQVRLQLRDLPTGEQPQVLMITVDPHRDDAAHLDTYVTFFDDSFTGATGPEEAIDRAAGFFGIPYARVELEDGNYTMDHGSGIFMVAPSGAVVAYSSAPHDAADLASDYRKVVGYWSQGNE